VDNTRNPKRPPPTPYPSIASIRDVIEPVTYRATAPALDGIGYRGRLPVTITKHRGSSSLAERVVSDDTTKYSIRPYKSIETTLPPTPAPTTQATTPSPPPPQISEFSKDDFDVSTLFSLLCCNERRIIRDAGYENHILKSLSLALFCFDMRARSSVQGMAASGT